MVFNLLADLVVLLHFAFIVFAILGGFLALKWMRVVWVHLPVVVYAAMIEFYGWICPLTPGENWLRQRGGGAGYDETFIEHYVTPIIYPPGLTFSLQITLGILVVAVNVTIYAWLIRRRRTRREA
jgi:hypothetical protein